MKRIKTIKAVVFSAACTGALLLIPEMNAEAAVSGSCGSGVRFSYADGTLTISGNGEMNDYSYDDVPWNDIRNSITSVVIEKGVTSIGSCAFEYCYFLSSVTIPVKVTSIGQSAFSGCAELESVVLPESLVSIGENAFSQCGLTSITIPANTESIGALAFAGCSQLPSVVIPENVAEIGSHAFGSCKSLYTVSIRNPQCVIADSAIPEEAKIIGYDGSTAQSYAEKNGISFTSSGAAPVVTASGTCGDSTSWKLYDGVRLVVSGSGWIESTASAEDQPWYEYSKQITEVEVRYGVSTLGQCCFEGFNNLTRVSLPSCIYSIQYSAFASCHSLTSISLPEDLRYIGPSAFSNCNSLTSITFSENLYTIDDHAFNSCDSLKSVQIPESVHNIENSVFNYCDSLEYISIPAGVEKINGNPVNGCQSLKEVIVDPENSYYKSVDGVLFSKDGTVLKAYPLGKEDNEYTVPSGVCTIGIYAFNESAHLTSINLPDTLKFIEWGAFMNCTSLLSIDIPDGVTEIGGSAFESCTALSSVNIPDSIRIIRWNTFGYCDSLSKVVIPVGTVDLDMSAFSSSGLKTVSVLNPHCQLGRNAVPSAAVIYGYDGSGAEAYAAEYGNTFISLGAAPVINSGITGDVNGDYSVDLADASAVLTYYARKAAGLDADELSGADINGDGVIAVSDASAILTYYARSAAGLEPQWSEIIS